MVITADHTASMSLMSLYIGLFGGGDLRESVYQDYHVLFRPLWYDFVHCFGNDAFLGFFWAFGHSSEHYN
jgi:hypothetical protein